MNIDCEKPMENGAGLNRNLSHYRGVWVFIEQQEGRIMPVSKELLGAGRQLAEKLGVELSGILLGDQVDTLVEQIYEYGADRVYLTDNPALRHYRTDAYVLCFVALAKKYLPEIILMGATVNGRDLAGAVATDLATGLTADCTGLDVNPEDRLLLATRPAFGGNIMATILTRKHRPQMASVRHKVMPMPKPEPGRKGELVISQIDLSGVEHTTRILEIVRNAEQLSLPEADIIVAGGRGLGDKSGFERLCYGLAGSTGAKVGGSRAAVEAGWIEPKYQVGQTGVTVAPRIYFALGISGAVQHLVGIRGSDTIVAVNKDPNAPIFYECSYGIVGDVFRIVPMLTEQLKKFTGKNIKLTRQPVSQEGISIA